MNTPTRQHGLTLWQRFRVPFTLVAIMIFVTAMSAIIFMHQSLRLDEAQSLWQSSRSPLKILFIVAQDVHVPLYHIVLHYWQAFFGNGVTAVRILSLIFFLISIPAFYMLGKLAYGTREGLFAALLLSISPFMNWYGNEVRMYSLFTLLIILHQYLFISIYKSRRAQYRSWYWLLYGMVSLAGIFTHYFFMFSLISQAVFFLFNRKLFTKSDLRPTLRIIGLLAIAFAPWIIYVLSLGTFGNSSPLLNAPTTVNIFNTFSQFLFGFQADSINTILLSLWPLVVLMLFLGLRKYKAMTNETMYFITSLIVPMMLAFIVSILVRPLYLSRYLILSLPSLYLIITSFVFSFHRRARIAFQIIIASIMVIMLVIEALSTQTPVKENYREASAYLTTHATASDIIVISAPFTIYPVEYYYRGPAELVTMPYWDRASYGAIPSYTQSAIEEQVATLKTSNQNLWLLQSYDQGYEEQLRMYFDTHFERLQAKEFSAGLHLYEYKLRYP